MERGEIRERLEAVEHGGIEKSRPREENSSVDDAVSHGIEGSGLGDEAGEPVGVRRAGGGLQIPRQEQAICRIEKPELAIARSGVDDKHSGGARHPGQIQSRISGGSSPCSRV